MDESARENGHRWQCGESVGGDINPLLLAPPLTCRSERREVRRGGASCQHSVPLRWQREEVLQPRERKLFELGADRTHIPTARVLVDKDGEPVRRERSRRA